MKRAKKLGILLGILGLVCVAALAALHLEERREQIKNSGEIILDLSVDSIQSLSWTYEGQELRFQKDETWHYAEDEAFPVSTEKMDTLLSLFDGLGASLTIEDVEDYGQYGLDDPLCTINLTAEGQSCQILLGDYSTLDAKRYLSIGDGKVYLTETDLFDYFCIGLESMIEHDEIPILDTVSKLRFSGSVNGSIFYEEDSGRTYSGEDVYFLQKNAASLALDTAKVDSYLQTISGLTPGNYVTYNAGEDELHTYGLDDPDLTITADYTDSGQEETFVLHISQDPEASGGESDPDNIKAYMRVGDSSIVYPLSAGEYQTLMAASYDDLRHREVFWGDFQDVSQIDISLEGRTHTLYPEKDGDSLVLSYQDMTYEAESLQYALENITAASFTNETPTQKLEIRLRLYLDHAAQETVTIELYRRDGSNCLAVVDGSPVSLVARSKVVDLIEAVQEIVLD